MSHSAPMRSMNACLMSLTFGSSNGRVVDENLDGVGAPILDALHRDVRQQVGQAARLRVVVAAQFVGQQQAGIASCAPWRPAVRIRDRAEWRWRAASRPW